MHHKIFVTAFLAATGFVYPIVIANSTKNGSNPLTLVSVIYSELRRYL